MVAFQSLSVLVARSSHIGHNVVGGVRIRTEAVCIFRLLFYGYVGYAIVDKLPAVFVFLVGCQLRDSRTEAELDLSYLSGIFSV